MTQNRDISSLNDILEAAGYIGQFTESMDFETFQGNMMCYSAVIRQIEIIGEAANRISKPFQALHPEVPWRKIIGMRNILIHNYHDIVEDEVWQAATVSVPKLVAQIKHVLALITE